MNRLAYIVIGFLVLIACSEKEEKVMDIHDIIPSSERDYDKKKGDSLEQNSDPLLNVILESELAFNSMEPIKERLFPDRFGPDTSFHFKLIGQKDTVRYHKWVYSDSLKTMNAFYNWMDCFGEDCRSIFIGEERNLKKEALQIFVSDTTILMIEGKKVEFEPWIKLHETLGYENDFNYLIEQSFRGKARWFTFEDEKKIKYKTK